METITTRNVQLATPRPIKKNLEKAKKITKNSFEINKELSEKERSEINNIIAILLDDKLSMSTRLRRAGRSPASTGIVRSFKKNIIKFAKEYAKKQILSKQAAKGKTWAVLSWRVQDISLSSFLRRGVESAITEAVAQEKSQSNSPTVTKNVAKGKEVEAKETSTTRTRRSRTTNPRLRQSPLSKMNISGKPVVKTTPYIEQTSLKSLKGIGFSQQISFERPTKISQVKELENSRKNPAKTQDIGRTMPEYPPKIY